MHAWLFVRACTIPLILAHSSFFLCIIFFLILVFSVFFKYRYVVGGKDGDIASEDLHNSADVNPQNDLTIEEKVSTALDVAESIATLHGYSGGVMVHNDIKLDQWLVNKDGTIKLNDFNRAQIMLYDVNNDEYCRYQKGTGRGDVSFVATRKEQENQERNRRNTFVFSWRIHVFTYSVAAA